MRGEERTKEEDTKVKEEEKRWKEEKDRKIKEGSEGEMKGRGH